MILFGIFCGTSLEKRQEKVGSDSNKKRGQSSFRISSTVIVVNFDILSVF